MQQQMIGPEQARLLRTGFTLSGIDNLPHNLPPINQFLTALTQSEQQEPVALPREFTVQVRDLSKLVLEAELDYTGALVRTGRTRELDSRIANGAGFDAKYLLLKDLIAISPVQEPTQG